MTNMTSLTYMTDLTGMTGMPLLLIDFTLLFAFSFVTCHSFLYAFEKPDLLYHHIYLLMFFCRAIIWAV